MVWSRSGAPGGITRVRILPFPQTGPTIACQELGWAALFVALLPLLRPLRDTAAGKAVLPQAGGWFASALVIPDADGRRC